MALQTYSVNVGSNYEFKMGDVIRLTLKDGYTFITAEDNYSTGPADLVQAAIADPSTGSLVVFGREYIGDTLGTSKFIPKYKITWNPVNIEAEGHNDGLDGLVDATKITVLRNEVITAKNKIVVTKEKLAYYHSKVKSLLNAKGTVQKVNYAGSDYTPDADGVINLPDGIPTMASGDMGEESIRFTYFSKETPEQANFDENMLIFNNSESADGLTVQLYKAGTQSFKTLLPNKDYVDDKAAACSTLKFQKVDTLPNAADAEDGIIYLIENTSAGTNVYDEYFRVNKGDATTPNYALELFGTTAVDLTDYLQETDVTEITDAEIDEIVA